jgi:predicted Zn-dependent protease with MMP-like domain
MADPFPTAHMDPPNLADMEALARHALATIPPRLARHVQDVVVRVVDFPDRETMTEMGLNSPFDLLGLYRGVSLDRKSVGDAPTDLDMIFLYRRPLLDYWIETEEPLWRIVRNVVIHECGHHFGLSDEEMARIEGEA